MSRIPVIHNMEHIGNASFNADGQMVVDFHESYRRELAELAKTGNIHIFHLDMVLVAAERAT